LEEIQAEVLRHDSQTASDMIQNLAVYLRIGLSGGSDLIPISSEIQHASAYINIMNQRFGQTILFMYQIEPSLSDHLILKTILQPLIENSIRHGFGIDAQAAPIPAPTIEIHISEEDGNLKINVSDNGSGFDEIATKSIMVSESPSEAHKHVGIHNVYQRLITFYGKDAISVKLSSIPYYQNTIELQIRESLH
jgi:two-component system sensor histidine kinase YesM